MENHLRVLMTFLPKIRDYFQQNVDAYPDASQTQVIQTVQKILLEFSD